MSLAGRWIRHCLVIISTVLLLLSHIVRGDFARSFHSQVMLVIVVLVTLIEASLVDTSFLHRLCRGVIDWDDGHEICRPIECIVYVLHLEASDPLKCRTIHVVMCTVNLVELGC